MTSTSKCSELLIKRFKNFNDSFLYLLNVITEISDKTKGTKSKLWQDSFALFRKASSSGKGNFMNTFITFYTNYSKFFEDPFFIRNADGKFTANDFLKTEEYFSGPGFTAKEASSDPENHLNGYVLYYNDNPGLYKYSIPISLIYLRSLELFKNASDDKDRAYVYKLLLGLFYTTYYSLPDIIDSKELILDNILIIQNKVDEFQTEKEQSSAGGGLSFITDKIGLIMKSAGLGDKFDGNMLNEMIGGKLNDNVLGNVGTVIKEIVESVGVGDPSDFKGLSQRIGQALQSDTISTAIDSIATSHKLENEELLKTIPSSTSRQKSEPPSASPIDYVQNPEDQD